MINTRQHFFKRAEWKRKFVFLPVQCHVTGKTVWLDYAWKGIAKWGKKKEVRWVINQHYTVPLPEPVDVIYEWCDINTVD
jgi:hypothetical protein